MRSEPAHDGSSSGAWLASTWRRWSGSRPSRTRSSSTGVPAAQACGRAAVGYAIGKGVSERGSPAKTSGSEYENQEAASRIRRTIRYASDQRP